MCSTVPSATEGNLHNPTFGRALGGIVEQRFLIETKEDFLDDILGFTAVIQDAKRNCEHQPRIATEEQIQSLCIFDLEANHEFFVAWGASLSGLGRCDRVLSTRTPYYGECQRAPIQRRAHFTMVALLDTSVKLRTDALSRTSTELPPSVPGRIQQIANVFPDKNLFYLQQKRAAAGTNLRYLPYQPDRGGGAISFLRQTGLW